MIQIPLISLFISLLISLIEILLIDITLIINFNLSNIFRYFNNLSHMAATV